MAAQMSKDIANWARRTPPPPLPVVEVLADPDCLSVSDDSFVTCAEAKQEVGTARTADAAAGSLSDLPCSADVEGNASAQIRQGEQKAGVTTAANELDRHSTSPRQIAWEMHKLPMCRN